MKDDAEQAPEWKRVPLQPKADRPFPVWTALGCLVVVGLIAAVVIPEMTQRRCVVAGTEIATPTGPRIVEDLRVGDAVLSHEGAGTVTAIYAARADEHLTLTCDDGRVLDVTAPHPIATDRGWVEAGALRPGDRLRTRDGLSALRAVARREREVSVYDLTVAPHASFFAGGLLVHNKTSPEAMAIGYLKTIGTAQSLFREGDKDNDGELDYANSLTELSEAGLIDAVLGATGKRYGYDFAVRHHPLTSEFLWMATANRNGDVEWTERYFVTNHEGVTYYRTDKPFALNAACEIPKDARAVGK